MSDSLNSVQAITRKSSPFDAASIFSDISNLYNKFMCVNIRITRVGKRLVQPAHVLAVMARKG